jgi:hypothetical protein
MARTVLQRSSSLYNHYQGFAQLCVGCKLHVHTSATTTVALLNKSEGG